MQVFRRISAHDTITMQIVTSRHMTRHTRHDSSIKTAAKQQQKTTPQQRYPRRSKGQDPARGAALGRTLGELAKYSTTAPPSMASPLAPSTASTPDTFDGLSLDGLSLDGSSLDELSPEPSPNGLSPDGAALDTHDELHLDTFDGLSPDTFDELHPDGLRSSPEGANPAFIVISSEGFAPNQVLDIAWILGTPARRPEEGSPPPLAWLWRARLASVQAQRARPVLSLSPLPR
jgi:hypothetical protein